MNGLHDVFNLYKQQWQAGNPKMI